MLIDTHAHLNDKRLAPHAQEISKNMASDNLLALINVGFDFDSSLLALKQTEYPHVFCALGIHPHDAKSALPTHYDQLLRLSKNPKVVAIGEFGLDYYYDHSPREAQQQSMRDHLELAHQAQLPIILHCRDAYGDLLSILRQNKDKLAHGGVVHCYSGSLETAKDFLRLGLHLSFGGVITFKNAKSALEVATNIPHEHIIVETDCPYLTPEPHRGQLNYPKYVNFVAQKLALLWNKSIEETSTITTQNAQRLFSKLI